MPTGEDDPEREPDDTLCFRPTKPFAQKSRHPELLKKGVDKDMRLEIDVGADAKQAVTVIGWVVAVNSMISMCGFDAVFRMCAMSRAGNLSNEVCICEKWGQVDMEILLAWMQT